jgi:stage V sporulation protein B
MSNNTDNNNSRNGLMFQAGILAAAGIISRIIGLLYRSPLVAIIGEVGNGYYTVAYNIYAIVLLVSSYSIPSAMSKIISGKLAVREYRNAHRIFKCALIYVTIVGGIGSLCLFLFADTLAVGNSATVLRFFAPTIFVFGFLGVLRGYFQAHKTMIPTSISQLIEQIFNAIVSVVGALILTRMAGDDSVKRPVYGAIGSALGTGSGVLIALLFMALVYYYNTPNIRRRVSQDTHDDMPVKEIFRLILMIVTPFVLSTCIYNLSASLNSTLFSRILMHVKHVDDEVIAYHYSIYGGKAITITNLPIALASAAASAMIPEISSNFARGNKKEATDAISRVIRVILMISIPCAAGLFALARPVMMILFPQKDALAEGGLLLMILAVTVVLYSLSTVTNAVLQAIGRVNAPVTNAFIALVLQTGLLAILLLFTDLNEIALCIVTIVYSFMMCLLNNIVMNRHIRLEYDLKKTYILPVVSSIIMGGAAYLVHMVFSLLLNLFMGSEYFVNLISTIIAVFAGITVYFLVLIKTGGASREDIKRFPKGNSIVALLERIHIF